MTGSTSARCESR